MTELEVKYKILDDKATIPTYSKSGDACLDFTATSKTYDEYGNTVYGTGLALEIPEGYVGLIFPRSSITKNIQFLANSVGVIDSGYRGEIMFKFKPTVKGHAGMFDTTYEVGDRIGQILILPYPKLKFITTDNLSETDRGVGGYGSTGK